MGDRNSKLWTIGQLTGKKIETTEDIREQLPNLPYNLLCGDLRSLDKLEAIIQHLQTPAPAVQGFNDYKRIGRIKSLQQMGLWVIVQRCPIYHSSTDAIVGVEHYLVEAHTDERTATEQLQCYQVEDDPDRETILMEPYRVVWGQRQEFSSVEPLGTFESKSMADDYALQLSNYYHSVWICTADKDTPDLINPTYTKANRLPLPNPHLSDPDDTPF